MKATFILIVIFTFGLALPSSQASEAVLRDTSLINLKIDSLFSTWNNSDSPGMMVSISKKGNSVYQKGFGIADLEHDLPINSETIFDVGSISKQFTGYAIAVLINEGRLSINDDIRDYLPELHDHAHTITIGHLLYHTSGLRDSPALMELAGFRIDDAWTFDRLLRIAFNQKELNFTPGSEYSYSNTGYNLLAEIVQRVTGQGFHEWTEENIFRPLNMKNSHFQHDYTSIKKNKAKSYSLGDHSNYYSHPHNASCLGAGSLLTSTEDLQKWSGFLMNPQDRDKAILETMLQVGKLNNGSSTRYAFGVGLLDYAGINMIRHSGQWTSFNSTLNCYPDHQLSIAILANTDVNPSQIATQIADLYLDEYKEQTDKKDIQQIELNKSLLQKFATTYRNETMGIERQIQMTGGALFYVRSPENKTLMLPISDNYFVLQNSEQKIEVMFKSQNEKRTMLVTVNESDSLLFKEFTPMQYSASQLKSLEGTFFCEELETSYSIVVEEDLLTAKHIWGNLVKFTPLRKDYFKGDQRYFESMEYVRDENDIITGIRVGNFRNRGIWFKKVY